MNVASEDDIQRMVDDTWNRIIDINLTGVMRAMRKVIPHFVEQGGGTMVNMASISSLTGGRDDLAYTSCDTCSC